MRTWPFSLAFLQQSNKGAAAARNLGVSRARADLIVFLDSDVIADSRLLEQHLGSQVDCEDQVVIGRMQPWRRIPRPWYEEVIDPESAGRDYGDQPRVVPFTYAYTCNMSVRHAIFRRLDGFDDSFPAAGFEDTEFAYRSNLLGYRVSYQPGCLGYHNHSLTLKQRINKDEAYSASLVLLLKKHPIIRTTMPGVDEMVSFWSSPRSVQSIWRRSRASFLALSPIRAALYGGLLWLDSHQKYPRLASILYWRLLTGSRRVGFREGLKQFGYSP